MLPDDLTTALLIRARSYIERGWCRHGSAKDASGRLVHPYSCNAVRWCPIGALNVAGWNNAWPHPAFQRLQAAIGDQSISEWNDYQETVEPVLEAFDRAIAGDPP